MGTLSGCHEMVACPCGCRTLVTGYTARDLARYYVPTERAIRGADNNARANRHEAQTGAIVCAMDIKGVGIDNERYSHTRYAVAEILQPVWSA